MGCGRSSRGPGNPENRAPLRGFPLGRERRSCLVRDYDRDRRWSKTYALSFDGPSAIRLIWDRSVQDRYRDPGTPLLRTLPNGKRVIAVPDLRLLHKTSMRSDFVIVPSSPRRSVALRDQNVSNT